MHHLSVCLLFRLSVGPSVSVSFRLGVHGKILEKNDASAVTSRAHFQRQVVSFCCYILLCKYNSY